MNRQKEIHLASLDIAYDTTDYLEGLSMIRQADNWQWLLTRDLVAHARSEGRSWAEIGMALGISRQAAQQRFGHAQH